jgi:hypothetical protein
MDLFAILRRKERFAVEVQSKGAWTAVRSGITSKEDALLQRDRWRQRGDHARVVDRRRQEVKKDGEL